MVNRLAHAPSRSSRTTGRRSVPNDPYLKRDARPLPRGDLRVSSQNLDVAIAQLASGLRILLNLGLAGESDNLELRSEDMGSDATSVNATDRYDVYVVENYEDGAGAGKSNWTRVGVAFPHKDSLGLNVELRAIPVSGKLVIRRHEAKLKSTES